MSKNHIAVILVGLFIGGIVGVTLGVAADKPLPTEHIELVQQMKELDRRMDIDVNQAKQLQAENEEIDREIQRLRSEVSGEPANNEVYWSNLARFTAGAETAGEILRELDRWGHDRFPDWEAWKKQEQEQEQEEGDD